MIESVTRELLAMRSEKGLLVLTEDCHNLDDASATLLHQLVPAGHIVVILTTRSGTHPPPALTEIWKDGFAERIELHNLSRREAMELLTKGLGGLVEDSSANGIWHVTAGNPLYLREVVLSSAETGALTHRDGEWRWRGEWATGDRLQEIVAARLGRLDPDELIAMEMLAVAGSLPLAVVVGATTPMAVEQLETRGLVRTERLGRRFEVAIAAPLHAEVLRGRIPALQQRSIRRNLVDSLVAAGARRATDSVRIACWSIESGLDVDPLTLDLGAQAALFGIGHAISSRIQEILPDHGSDLSSGPPVRHDLDLAVRLAQTAYDQGGGVVAGVRLATALAWSGATVRAERVLAELADKAGEIDDRLRLALALGWVRFWGRFDVSTAIAGLRDAANAAAQDSKHDPLLLADIYQELAGIALNTAHPAEALDYARQAAVAQGVELSQCRAAAAAAAALLYLGRCGEAIALVDEALPAAQASGNLVVAQLLFAKAGALSGAGDLRQAAEVAQWLRDVALSRGLLDATAMFGVLLGEILLHQGRPASAGRIFRDAAGLLAEKDLLGYRPWALSGLARARARSGQEESAASALADARKSRQIERHFDMSHNLAEIELCLLAGRKAEAVQAAREGAAWARDAGLALDEANVLDAWQRIEASDAIADRLAELADMTDSRRTKAIADNARALVAGNAEVLLDAGARFAEMSAWWHAAEAAGAAARCLERQHRSRASTAAARLAARYAEKCEGTRPASMAGRSGPARLTKREYEIASLAATGRSTKEIAEAVFVSERTVENHLHNAYVKLGVTDRAALAGVLKTEVSSE
jgi:DNA-binding NarL/FixJ family response regulator